MAVGIAVEFEIESELLDRHMKSPTLAGMAAPAPHFAGPPSLAQCEVA